MKIVVNRCYGGFSVSRKVVELLNARKGFNMNLEYGYLYLNEEDEIKYGASQIHRNDPDLIAIIEELGIEASTGNLAELEIVEIPAGVEWTIEEYDGREWIAEKHRTW
jgi:hypothetical protein